MKDSERLSLFVQVPFHASLNDGVASIKQSELYAVHAFKLDASFFPVLLQMKPCLVLISTLDEASKRESLRFLHDFRQYRRAQGQPVRDPALRVVVIAKDRQAAGTNWPDLGVYELMIAPVPPNVLTYKLSRHHQKALVADRQPRPSMPPEVAPMLEVAKHEAPGLQKEWRVFRASEPQPKSESRTFFEIEAALPSIDPEQGEWVSQAEEGAENRWEWKAQASSRFSAKLSFYGEKPVYEAARKSWKFSGEAPRLMRTHEEGAAEGTAVEGSAVEDFPAENAIAKDLNPRRSAAEEGATAGSGATASFGSTDAVAAGFTDDAATPAVATPTAATTAIAPAAIAGDAPRKNTSAQNSAPHSASRSRASSTVSTMTASKTAPPKSRSSTPPTSALTSSAPSLAPSPRLKSPSTPTTRSVSRTETLFQTHKPEAGRSSEIQAKAHLEIHAIRRMVYPEAHPDFESESQQESLHNALPSATSPGLTSPLPNSSRSDSPRSTLLPPPNSSRSHSRLPPSSSPTLQATTSPTAVPSSALPSTPKAQSKTREEDWDEVPEEAPGEALGEALDKTLDKALDESHGGISGKASSGQRRLRSVRIEGEGAPADENPVRIAADTEESFWSILYDDDDENAPRSAAQKPRVTTDLQGWELKLVRRARSPKTRLNQALGRTSINAQTVLHVPKQTLLDRVLRLIQALFGLGK